MQKKISISGKTIGDTSPCFIISEIGANHNNSLENAFRLIDLSKKAGADAVKFQSYRAETLYSKYVPRRQLEGGGLGPEIFPLIKKIATPYEWHRPLKDYCDKQEILFFSTPFDEEAVDSLEEIGCQFYKVASSEIGDPFLMKKIARTGKPMIVSTGKANLEEVAQTVNWIREEDNENIVLLHCTATYPARYESMNLRAMNTMKEKFHCPVGLSDHNMENITAVAAVALGAKVVEKHITLSRNMEGPDHKFALEPDGFAQLVDWIRKTEIALGSGVKEMDPSEREGKRIANRSVHVKSTLVAGHVLRLEDLAVKRPSLGISPAKVQELVGKKLKKEVMADMWLTWDDLE